MSSGVLFLFIFYRTSSVTESSAPSVGRERFIEGAQLGYRINDGFNVMAAMTTTYTSAMSCVFCHDGVMRQYVDVDASKGMRVEAHEKEYASTKLCRRFT